MKRTVIAELLDADAGTPAEIVASLADLRDINRWLGGVRTMRRLVRAVLQSRHLPTARLLDVGSGDGYVAGRIAQMLLRQGLLLNVTLLDCVASHLGDGPYRRVVGDALALPFSPSSFDLVICNLLTHHLEPEELLRFLNEALRVCRIAALIGDLRRNRLHWALAYAGGVLFRSRITRHDAVASVRRAYTAQEWAALVHQVPAASASIERYAPFRLGITLWKNCDG